MARVRNVEVSPRERSQHRPWRGLVVVCQITRTLESLARFSPRESVLVLTVLAPSLRSPVDRPLDDRSKVEGAWELGRGRFLRGPRASG